MRAHKLTALQSLFCLLAILCASMAGAAEPGARRVILSPNSDYAGFDYHTIKDVSLADCQAACIGDRACQALTYNTKAKWCFLKNGVGTLAQAANATAGKIFETPPKPKIEKAPELTFVAPETLSGAKSYAANLRSTAPSASTDPAALRASLDQAKSAKDYRLAVSLALQLVPFDPYGYELWRDLTQVLAGAAAVDSDARAQLNSDSISAAITAYEVGRSREQRAEALGLLAQAFERTEDFRKTLEAYKAALAQARGAELEQAYDRALAKYGFRVVDYTVDADASSPRICLQFSDEIGQSKAAYDTYVRLDDKPPAGVDVKEKQLCIDGAEHGKRHAVTVREGLPSIYSDVLEKPVTLSIYVRDRQPSVRFTGNNFVLPREGRQAIPIVSVNADEVALELYHIDARGLAPTVKDNDFLSQLSGYNAKSLAEDKGQKLWTGTLSVEKKLNEEVTTSIALSDILKERMPGVYVMLAKPKGGRADEWSAQATQWFIVSDIGLTTLSGNGGLHVFVRSLSSAKPLAETHIQLLARDNAVLGSITTDEAGHARFDAGLLRGAGGAAPALVTVNGKDGDYAFLDLTRAAFDLTDRGVGGREAPGPVDAFLYTDRGVYRPGETVHLTALARDDHADAIANLPLTFAITRPDGVEYLRRVSSSPELGGHSLDIDLVSSAMHGTWQAAAYTDPKADPIATIRFLVDAFIPERVEFELTSEAKSTAFGQPTEIKLEGRFLYGAAASGLALEGEVVYAPVRTLATYPGYSFGIEGEEVQPYRVPLEELGATDEEGKATISVQPGGLPESTQLYEARISVRMVEAGGRAVERRIALPVESGEPHIGIKPLFSSGGLGEGATAGFDIIALDEHGKRAAAKGLKWELLKVNENFQWYQTGGTWNYESAEYTERVANGILDVKADAPARIMGKVGWGKYRLDITSADKQGPESSIDFTAGWYVAKASSDTPDVLQVALDKPSYRVGDIARVKLTPRFAGTALVMVAGDDLIDMKPVEVGAEGADVEFKVTDAWTYGTYVAAALYRPAEGAGSHMPGRAIGIAYAPKDASDRTLAIALGGPEVSRPLAPLTIPVTLSGAAAGEEAYVTVAAVDVGILNLTRFQPPEPEGWYYGKRKLGQEWRDLYGQLIDGSLGTPGRIRSGGGDDGEGEMSMEGTPPTEAPVALYSGIVKLDAAGKAQVTFDVPQFNGTLRVMAVAWSGKKVGHGVKDVIVRDPVVIVASLPRFLAPGDQSRLHLDIDNAEGAAGDYQLSAATTDGLAIAGLPKTLTLAKGKRQSVLLPLTAKATGIQEIEVSLKGGSGIDIKRNLTLGVRPAQPATSERRIVSLKPGQTFAVTGDLIADRVPGTGRITISITRAGALDVPGIVQALDRYPYGCSEQTTSRALPLLYLDEVAAKAGLDSDAAIKERVQMAVYDVLANQSAEGGFGLWGPGSGDVWLDAYVTDFLTRAQERGYDIPAIPFRQALDNLQNTINYTQEINNGGADVAYALYVLARNKRASVGDLRFYAESKLGSFTTPLAKAQIGAALALYGDHERALRVLTAAFSALNATKEEDYNRLDYGSRLRDGAALLTLAAESTPSAKFIPALAQFVASQQVSRRYTSTQENSWMLLAARALIEGADTPEIEANGKRLTGDYVRRLTAGDLAAGPLTLVNRADHPIDLVMTYGGVPTTPEPAGGKGFTIERSYYTLGGEALPADGVAQSERAVVVLKVMQANKWPSRILITDLLPAGFEIDNPALVGSASLANFDWLPETAPEAHLEFRDDRFVAALTREAGDNADLTFAYVVRAVTPGHFALPPATVEDMYRPYLNARTESGEIEVVGPRQ